MNLTLHVWRQVQGSDKGDFETYQAEGVSEHMSFLEMLDTVNEKLTAEGREPIAFDHDCREGICGSCGFMINGEPHGPLQTTVCQLHMRTYKDGDELWLEPWRATAFPVLRDLVVDRSPLDRIIQAGGYISVRTGSAQDANATLIPKYNLDMAMDAAECIGCGACVAAVHRRQGDAPRPAAPGPARAIHPRCRDGAAARRGRLRPLHHARRLPERVPEGHQGGLHRAAERGYEEVADAASGFVRARRVCGFGL
jgi:succinate dehydrogenase/fumarate reductase-like Fe-S protein